MAIPEIHYASQLTRLGTRERARTLPVEHLRTLFSYDPNTGDIIHKPRPVSMFRPSLGLKYKRGAEWSWKLWMNKHAGKSAVHKKPNAGGHKLVAFGGSSYLAHRVAWALLNGEIPMGLYIDHINGDPSDNRLANLRLVDHATNMRNRKRGVGQAKNGAFGVRFDKRREKWCASIGSGPTKKWLGSFQTQDDAIAARRAAERELGYHENHGRSSNEDAQSCALTA